MAIMTRYIIIKELGLNNNLLINTLTSAMDIVDDDTRDKIKSAQMDFSKINDIFDENLYKNLKARGYIFETKDDENEMLNKIKKMDKVVRQDGLFTQYTICPTMGCNLRCTYCFEEDDLHKNFDVMTEEQLDIILDYILKNKKQISIKNPEVDKMDIMRINLFGGEPLLPSNKELIMKILDFGEKNNIKIGIITNGTTIDKYLEIIKRYKKVISVQITVDGNKEIHDCRRIRADGSGTFKEICDNIDLLIKTGVQIQYRINVDKNNIFDLKKLEQFVKDKKWNEYSNFIPYASPVLDFCGKNQNDTLTEHELYDLLVKEELYGKKESFLSRIVSPCIGYIENFFKENSGIKPWKTNFCEATSGSSMCFSPDGVIATCITNAGNEEYKIGNFDENGVYIDSDRFELWSKRNVFRIKKCSSCKYAFLCGGGCPVMALKRNGDIDKSICSDVALTINSYLEHNFKLKGIQYEI